MHAPSMIPSGNVLVTCPECAGKGAVQHRCDASTVVLLRRLVERSDPSSFEYVGLYACRVEGCRQVWKIVRAFAAGEGHREVWLRPGERREGLAFTAEEFEHEVVAA